MNDIAIVKDKYHGTFVVSNGIVSRLTECCEAAASFFCPGDPAKPEVLCCKKCYKPVDDVYADAALIGSPDYWDSIRRMMKDCSVMEGFDCVAEVDWKISEAVKTFETIR